MPCNTNYDSCSSGLNAAAQARVDAVGRAIVDSAVRAIECDIASAASQRQESVMIQPHTTNLLSGDKDAVIAALRSKGFAVDYDYMKSGLKATW